MWDKLCSKNHKALLLNDQIPRPPKFHNCVYPRLKIGQPRHDLADTILLFQPNDYQIEKYTKMK